MVKKKRKSFLPQSPIRLVHHDGQFHLVGVGVWYSYWRDPYHLLLTIPWPGFLIIISLLYVGVNVVFALGYLLGGDCIENAAANSFFDAFFFSVQTLASIGYGAMYPTTLYANILVTFEALIGLTGIAIVTGLSFARFAQPTARVIFSSVAVVTRYNHTPTLIFRTANQRGNQILEAKLKVYLMRDEQSIEGHLMRRFYELKLLRHDTPSFTLSWTAMHPITEKSPLFGETTESLLQSKAQILVSLTGLDETVAQMIHARQVYPAHKILWDYHFVDIFYETPEGDRFLDFTHFHDVIPN